jgi:hypothetical protein
MCADGQEPALSLWPLIQLAHREAMRERHRQVVSWVADQIPRNRRFR